jgi:hypothetical protein
VIFTRNSLALNLLAAGILCKMIVFHLGICKQLSLGAKVMYAFDVAARSFAG